MASRDYEEFIGALNERRARYLIVGAHAVAFHAQPRATKLDLFVEPTTENAQRVLDAMRDFFGGADLGYGVEDLTDPEWIVQLGVAPVRIDLHAGLEGLPDFERAWAGRVDAPFGSVDAHYLGLDDLLRAKEAAGREQDRADLVALRRVGR
ncbi:MAG: nucleotidyltransferase [bacterium]